MAGVSFTFDAPELGGVIARLERDQRTAPARKAKLGDAIGALLESSTKRRISDEKKAPDGADWPGWSPAYGETRGPGHSLLQNENDLLTSIQALGSPDQVQIGSNLVYAAIHQLGGEEVGIPIPPRPYLGLSATDETDIRDLAEDFLRGGLE